MKRNILCGLVLCLGVCSQANGQGGIITTIAGNGHQGFSGDGGPAPSASLDLLGAVAVDASGNIFVADTGNGRIRRVSANGIITTVAGNGGYGFSGDGGAAASASLSTPYGVALDASGNLFIADTGNSRIRRVSAAGVISTVAGNGSGGFSGDGGAAASASLSAPYGVAVDASGNIYIADSGNHRIRKVSASGIISTVAGNGTQGLSGDGGLATSASLSFPTGVAVDVSGNLFIADRDNSRIRKVLPSGTISTVAGSGEPGIFFENATFAGDGGPATAASLSIPDGVAVDATGNIFIADTYNNRVRKVAVNGIISTVAGSGAFIDILSQSYGYNACCVIDLGTGDSGPATSAALDIPFGLAVDVSGNIFISDTYDFRIREVLAQTSTSTAPNAPVLSAGGIFNASLNSRALPASPGSLISIFGLNLGTSAESAVANSSGQLPLSMAGVSVQFGSISAPLLYVSPTQINAQVPFELAPRTYAVTVTTAAGASNSIDLNVTATSPGVFAGAVVDYTTGAVIDASHPFRPGDVIVIYCTGLGTVSPGGITGQLAPDSPISFTTATPTVTIGGLPVQVANSVLTPGFVGLYQVGIVVPGGLQQGALPLAVTSGGVTAPASQVVSAPSLNSQYCADVSGAWNVTESGTVTETAVAAIESDNVTNPYSEQGTINIVQAGCSISYIPTPIPGLVTQDQAAALVRTGTVVGTSVSLQGPLTTQALAVSNQPDLTITQVSENQFQASGQLTGAILTTTDSGNFTGSGTYSYNGQTGTFTLTYVTAGATTLLRPEVGPTITVAPAALNFQTQEGGPPQSLSLQIGGTAGLAWQATAATPAGGAWLSIPPQSGRIPELFPVTVNPGSLAVGTYYGTIAIQAPDVSPPSSSTISVTLTITAASGPGIIMTVAGSGSAGPFADGGFSGDGGPATAALLTGPSSVALDASGNLFIADTNNERIRKVTANGIITTVAGDGTPQCPSNNCFSGDGGLATAAQLHGPTGVAVDAFGNIFIADDSNSRIRKVSANGTITTVAGNGNIGFSGDGGPATSAELNNPIGIAVDASGNLFIADSGNGRIRRLSADGKIITVAGNGTVAYNGYGAVIAGYSGDGGPATSANLTWPTNVAVDVSGNLFIADTGNQRIRKVSASGIITTVAGTGPCTVVPCGSFKGYGGLATSAYFVYPTDVAVDASGNLFIVDYESNVILHVSATSGIITTVAGNGTQQCGSNNCFSGDGGLATSATLDDPAGVALDTSGNLLIADSANNRIRKVSSVGAPAAGSPAVSPVGRTGVFDLRHLLVRP